MVGEGAEVAGRCERDLSSCAAQIFCPMPTKNAGGLLRCTEQSLEASGPIEDAAAIFLVAAFSEPSATNPPPSGERYMIHLICQNHGG